MSLYFALQTVENNENKKSVKFQVETLNCCEFIQVFVFIANHYRKSCLPGRVAQSVGHLTRKSGVLGSTPGLATYFCFSFRFFKKGSCQILAKVCARSTG